MASPPVLTVDVAAIDHDRILRAAEAALRLEPITITKWHSPLSQGGTNDFYSNADYFWPDPKKPDGLPYINRDGESNPDNFWQHRMAMRHLRDAVAALAAAYKITGDEHYAVKAAELLRVFFLDPQTRMNPNLQYAQAVPGSSPGRSYGIIDGLHLIEIPPAIMAMEKSPAFTPELVGGLKQWFQEMSDWMLRSTNGRTESAAHNNHAVAYWLQIACYARFTGDEAKLAECRSEFKEVFVPVQMATNGSFPLELARTKPYGYSIFQLDNMVALCQVLSTPSDDLWAFEMPDGRGIRKAVAYLYPYLADKSKWPFKPDVQAWESWPSRQPGLLFAGLALGEPEYLELWRKLPADPVDPEVRRNIAITQPILWVQAQDAPKFNVIAFYTGKDDLAHISFVHEANRWFPQMAAKYGFSYTATTNWNELNAEVLSNYQVVLFLDTRPEGPAQRAALQKYMEQGGAWMGFHFSAFAMNQSGVPQNWGWYHDTFLGSGEYLSNTWRPTSAVLRVEDTNFPAMQNLPETFKSAPNEWYRWQNDLRKNPDIKILVSIDPASFPLGTGTGSGGASEIWTSGYYPVVWTNTHYRMIYVNMGHNDMDYEHKYDNSNRTLSYTFENETEAKLVLDSLLWLGGGKK